jgi:hypothetical protein
LYFSVNLYSPILSFSFQVFHLQHNTFIYDDVCSLHSILNHFNLVYKEFWCFYDSLGENCIVLEMACNWSRANLAILASTESARRKTCRTRHMTFCQFIILFYRYKRRMEVIVRRRPAGAKRRKLNPTNVCNCSYLNLNITQSHRFNIFYITWKNLVPLSNFYQSTLTFTY